MGLVRREERGREHGGEREWREGREQRGESGGGRGEGGGMETIRNVEE